MRNLNYDDGRRYPPRAFRRGPAREIVNSGSTFSAIPRSGPWPAGWYLFYIDLHADESVNMSALLATAIESDSDDQDELPPVARGGGEPDNAMGSVRRLL